MTGEPERKRSTVPAASFNFQLIISLLYLEVFCYFLLLPPASLNTHMRTHTHTHTHTHARTHAHTHTHTHSSTFIVWGPWDCP